MLNSFLLICTSLQHASNTANHYAFNLHLKDISQKISNEITRANKKGSNGYSLSSHFVIDSGQSYNAIMDNTKGKKEQ